jgi:hypothetical protein
MMNSAALAASVSVSLPWSDVASRLEFTLITRGCEGYCHPELVQTAGAGRLPGQLGGVIVGVALEVWLVGCALVGKAVTAEGGGRTQAGH